MLCLGRGSKRGFWTMVTVDERTDAAWSVPMTASMDTSRAVNTGAFLVEEAVPDGEALQPVLLNMVKSI